MSSDFIIKTETISDKQKNEILANECELWLHKGSNKDELSFILDQLLTNNKPI